MTLKNIYPICAPSFKNWRLTNLKYNKIYNHLGNPKPFDVTLKNKLHNFKINQPIFNSRFYFKQLDLYHKICLKYQPNGIEICSIVTDKLLPLFTDVVILYNYIEEHQTSLQIELLELNGLLNRKMDNFIFVPNTKFLKKIDNFMDYKKLNNISFVTSISESFHNETTQTSLQNSDQEIYEMMHNFDENLNIKYPPFVKIYVSCINECPINGKINNNFIINRLLEINKMKVDNICLSDTCGTLNANDFEYIVDNCNNNGLPFNKLSLQLRVKPNRELEIEQLMHKALDRKIINFDVSLTEINKNDTIPILSYEQYYKFLVNYIEKYDKI
jgi:hypothetical protein